MSQRQQLINKYIYDLKPAISARYQLHFLSIETDDPARQMVISSLNQISQNNNQPQIKTICKKLQENPNSSIVFGQKVKEPKEMIQPNGTPGFQTNTNFSILASNAFNSFQFQKAIKYFDKGRKSLNPEGSFYQERAECYFMLENYDKAYSLAKKSGNPLWTFLMALVTGRFNEAASYCDLIISILTERTDAQNSHNKVVNNFDLYQLLMYVLLASQPATRVVEVYEQLSSAALSYSFESIKQIVDCFKVHQYGAALQYINLLRSEINQSIYSFPVENQLKDAIIQNLIVNFVRPFGTIRIDDISKETKIDKNRITKALICAIRAGELIGRIDPDQGIFSRSESRYAQVQASYDQLQIIRQRIELALWNTEIAKEVKFK